MSAPCDGLRQDLALYAEGELKDRPRAARLRVHLDSCSHCRHWLERHDALTRAILAAELGPGTEPGLGTEPGTELGPGSELSRVEEGSLEESLPASLQGPAPAFPAARWRRSPGGPEGTVLVDRVMAGVRGVESARKRARWAARAAAALVLLGLGAGGLLWLNGRPRPEAMPLALEGEPLEPAAIEAVLLPPAERAGTAREDLASAWWVPHGSLAEARAREVETVLYTLVPGFTGEASGDRGGRAGACIVLRAQLGPEGRPEDFKLVMVPEGGPGGAALPVRLLASPVELDESQLGEPARVLLRSPPRRYRIFHVGSYDPGILGRPEALRPGPADPLERWRPVRPAVDFLPPTNQY